MNNIICALSSAPGMGAIALIRLSGEGVLALLDTVFESPSKKKIVNQVANSVLFGYIKKGDEIVDEVLVSIFKAPHSFTGEDTVEISCHGSLFVQQAIVEVMLSSGATLAKPGEFTQRAFLNGKIDLSQAEAVADLISSTSAGMHQVAMSQMRGGFSSELKELREKMIDFVSLVELELDFSEEDVEFADRGELQKLTNELDSHIMRLINSFKFGNAIKNGIPVAIVGETNAGKSTLLNVLLNEEKAIVSDIHGTTRDSIEDTVVIDGIEFRFIDTAGIRDTADTIESIGIERSFKMLEQATIVLWVIDSTSSSESIEELSKLILPRINDKKLITIFNKADLLSPESIGKLKNLTCFDDDNSIYISAKERNNIDELHHILMEAANIPQIGKNEVVVTNMRHYEALSLAHQAIERVKNGLDMGISGDFLSQDIREALLYIGEITGEVSSNNILHNIFSKFCIGK